MALETLEIKIKTLTPLWTGGVDTTMDRIHETGIMGSLRWWYEAIVRGLGGSACDPTEHACELAGKRLRRYKNALKEGKDWWTALDEAGICDACKVFGTTGWRRRFRLEIVEDNTEPLWEPKDKMLNIRPPGRTRGWYLPPGRMGSLTLKFTGEPRVLSLIASIFLFLEKWGSIGAKPQLGYGVFEIERRKEVLEWVKGSGKDKPGWKWEILGDKNPNEKLPDLRRFGFFKFQFEITHPDWWTKIPGLKSIDKQLQLIVSKNHVVPITPILRNEWRFNQWKKTWGDDREIFGTLKPDRIRSKVAVSWAYKREEIWEIKGWGWFIPSSLAYKLKKIIKNKQAWQNALNNLKDLKIVKFEFQDKVSKEDVLNAIQIQKL
ncbi:MAG: type III-B CRISPR module RAMP protein Cmr1 [Candidatus Hydrothermota bacterium]|nr:MAG: type III-B CRISPR module RAMP protein Cmr1 [Candidatus Hydrothermae bacterium]